MPDIIDVEASGFGRGSYPIEVGVALDTGKTVSFLIRPFDDWTHWTEEAESLHRISREVLRTHGLPPDTVASKLNELLAGKVLYTDAWGVDSSWLGLLHERTEIPAHYRLESISTLLNEAQRAGWGELKAQARRELDITRHRASADALVLRRAYEASLGSRQSGA